MGKLGILLVGFIAASCVGGKPEPLCPYGGVLATAERATLGDTHIYLTDLKQKCERGEDGEEWRVHITLRGYADDEFAAGDYPIFVALVDTDSSSGGTDSRILSRLEQNITIDERNFEIDLPAFAYAAKEGREHRTYRNSRLVLGWVLTDEQLAANRREWERSLYPQVNK